MAGGELIIDDKLVGAIHDMEKALRGVAKGANKAQRNTLKWIKQLRTSDINTFVQSIQQLQNEYTSLSSTLSNVSGMEKVASSSSEAVSKINNLISVVGGMPSVWGNATDKASRFAELMSRINNDNPQNRRNSAMAKLDEEIESSLRRLSELQKQLKFYTKGEGKTAVGFVDLSAIQAEARGLMNHIDLLKRKRESVAANARLRLKLSEMQEARDNQWTNMEVSRQKKLQEAQRETNEQVKKNSEAISESREQQTRAYTNLFDQAISKDYERLVTEKERQAKIEDELEKKRYEDWQWQKQAEFNEQQREEEKVRKTAEKRRKEEEKQEQIREERRAREEKADGERYQTTLARMHAETKEHKRKEQEKEKATKEAIKRQNEEIKKAEQQRKTQESLRNKQQKDNLATKRNTEDVKNEHRETTLMYAKMFDSIDAEEKKKLEKSLDNYRRYYLELQRLTDEYNQLQDTKVQGVNAGINIDAVTEREKAINSLKSELQAKMNEISSSSTEAKRRSADIEKEIDASRKLVQTKKEITDATRRQREEEESQRKRFKDAASGAMDFANALMEVFNAKNKLNMQGDTSYDEAMSGYSFLFGGGGAKSLSNLREVQRALEEAKSKQDRFTESGKTRYNELNDALDKVKEAIDEVSEAGEEMGKSHHNLMDTSGQLMRQLALVFSVSQIEGYVNKLVSVRKEFELQQRSLQALLQNKQAANEIWNQTVQLALKSPFRVKDLVTYTKELAAYRIETEKLHDTTKMLADVSAGLGVDMSRLILAFGQVRAAEFLRGTELRQFTEAGIPMLEELANHFSALEGRAVSTADVFERISKRMVVFADVEAVFKKITSEGGAFYKMQEKQSDTLYGSISNLHDAIDIMLNDIGKSHDGLLKGSVSIARKMASNWQTIAVAIKAAAGAFALYKLNALLADKALVRMAVSMKVVTVGGAKQLTVMQLLNVGFLRLGKSIGAAGKAMKAFFLSNPWTAIIMAMAAAFVELYSTLSDHKKQLDDINKEYDELIRKVSNIRVKFTFSNDLTEKRQKLQELIDVAEQLNISPNIKMDGITAGNIDEIFDNLRKIVIERQGLITALTTDFEKATHWKITDDLNEDLKEVGDNITKLTPIIDKYKSSVIDYIDNLGRFTDERKKMFEPIRKDENDLQYYDRLVRAFNEVRKAQKEASTSTAHWIQIMDEAPSVIKDTFDEFTKWRANTNHYFDKDEAKKEFDAFIKEVKPMLKNIPEEDRSIAIKTWIDKEATKREWNTFTTQYLYKWFEEIPDLNIKFAAELPSEKSIPEWKMRVTDAVEKLNKKIKASLPEDSKIRLFTLPSDTDTKESWLNKFKLDIEEAKRVYQDNQAVFGEQEVARTNALKDYSREAEQIANIADKTTKEERDANTILNKRISLIKEIHSAYEKERKLWDAGTSEERVLQSYMLAYEEAFDKSISGYNFKIKDGVVSELLELIPLAEKAGKEAMIALNRAIASVEVEAGDFGKTLADENLVRQIEDMFGTYELSLELKDMNIPSDIAEKLFGLESLDLEGLKAKLEELEPEFVGTDLEEKYRDYLQKVAKMEKEAQQKRLKEYVAFARGAIGERAKVKLEEMQKLEDIEKAFTIKDTDDEDTKATKNKWRNEARKKAQEESANALKKLDWEALKSSDTFNMVFDDLERASEESLKNMIDKLKEFRDQWKDMPFDQMRQVVDLLQKAEEAYSSSSSPFAEGRRLKKAIEIDGRSEEQALLDLSSAESELLTLDNIIAKIQLFQQVKDGLASKETLASEDIELYNKYLSQSVDFYHQITNELSSELPLRYEILRLAQEGKLTEDAVLGLFTRETKTLNEQASGAKKRLTDGQKQAKIYQEQANAIKKMQQMANDLYDSFYDLANNVTELFGGEISETGKIFAESGQEMMNTVLNTISLQKELQAASAQASAFGKALNSAMGIVGWIVMGVQLISKVFSIVTQVHDNKIEKKIQSQIDSVEELEKQYKSLEKTLEHVYSIDTITKFSDDAVNNIDQQIAALDEMIALETEKKNQDEERIKEWYEQREESLEERERLLEEKEKALGGIGGEADYKEASERFVEAWLDAYQETGDGLKGLEEAFDEFFMNMVKKQLVARGVEKMMEPLFKEFDRMFDQDSDGNEKVTKKELDNFQNLWDEALPMMNTTLKSIVEQMGATDEILKGGELGTLQKGIQGITEDQANILASYLNSIRFIIGEHTGYLKTIASNYGDTEVPNPMLGQLQVIANQTSAIHTLLESVTKTGHPQGGYGIKVIM